MIGQKILLIGAHADDVEMNAGGSIHKWRQQGRHVQMAILASEDAHFRHVESREAAGHLHVEHVHALGGEDKSLHVSFNTLLESLERVLAGFAPDTVITHFHADTHQDHATTYKVAVASARNVPNFLMFKPTFPSGRPDIPFQPNVVSMLSSGDVDAKIRALNSFKSQRVKYGDDSWASAMAAVSKGDAWTYAGVHGYAEVFQLGRLRI